MRLAHYLVLLSKDPMLVEPVLDAAAYYARALEILKNPVGSDLFFQAPAYSYFAALMLLAGAGSKHALVAGQLVLSFFSIILVFFITRNIVPAGRKKVASMAAAYLAALFVPLIHFSCLWLKVQLSVFLGLAGMWLVLVSRNRDRLSVLYLTGAGVVWTLAAYTQGHYFIVLPFVLMGAAFTTGAMKRKNDAVSRALLFTAGILIVLTASGIRNYVASGKFAILPQNHGGVMYLSHNPQMPLGIYRALTFVRPDPRYEEHDFAREASRRSGKELSTEEAAAYWQRQAVEYIISQPWTFVLRTLNKLRLSITDFEIPDNYNEYFYSTFSPFLRLPFISFGIVMGFAFPGFISSLYRNERKKWMPVYLFLAGYLLALAIFFVRSRYRMPLIVGLLPLAGSGFSRIWETVVDRDVKKLITAIVFAAVGAGASFLATPHYSYGSSNFGPSLNSLGALHDRAGNHKMAIEYFNKAMKFDDGPVLRLNIAGILREIGEPSKALPYCEYVIGQSVRHPDGYLCKGRSLTDMGRLREAEEAFRNALAVDDKSSGAYIGLAKVVGMQGRGVEARKILEAALGRMPESSEIRSAYALLMRDVQSKSP